MTILEVLSLQGFLAFLAFILLLMVVGKLFYRADYISVALYAVITVEIMNLCFGLSNSISYILFSIVFEKNPVFFGFILMGAGSALVFALSVLCYRTYRNVAEVMKQQKENIYL